MSTPPAAAAVSTGTARPVLARIAVSAGYAAQGLGYATVVTALPSLKDRQHIGDTTVSLVVLLVCIAAAGGSVLAEAVATRASSRAAMVTGFLIQAAALPMIAIHLPTPGFIAAFGIYGIGLGMIDAAAGMQAVLVQHRYGTAIMSAFFGWYTGAAIVGALLMSVLGGPAVGWAIAVAAGVALSIALAGRRRFYGTDQAVAPLLADESGTSLPAIDDAATAGSSIGAGEDGADAPRRSVVPLPRRGIWLFGSVVLAAFVADSAVSTWSTVYLHDSLLTTTAVAPLGYAAYQAVILVSRLLGDRAVRRFGRPPIVVVTTVVAAIGFATVASLGSVAAAVLGFAIVGVGVGALVPLSFSAAGELAPDRSNEVIARLNLFNYVGAVLGAVVVGMLSDGPGLAKGFLIPMVLLLPTLAIARRFADRRPVPPVMAGAAA